MSSSTLLFRKSSEIVPKVYKLNKSSSFNSIWAFAKLSDIFICSVSRASGFCHHKCCISFQCQNGSGSDVIRIGSLFLSTLSAGGILQVLVIQWKIYQGSFISFGYIICRYVDQPFSVRGRRSRWRPFPSIVFSGFWSQHRA